MSDPQNASTATPTPGPAPVSGTGAIEAAAAQLTGKPAEAKQGDPAPVEDEALGEGGKKALKTERDRANELEKALKAANARLAEIDAANMSELERAQKAAQDAQEAAAKATTDALRFRVASQHGISEEDAELFLTGTDAETLARQATRLKERTPTSPLPDPSQGAQHAQPLNGDGLTEALSRAVGARQR